MNIILLEKQEVQGGTVLLTDRRAKHLIKVLQVQVGDTVRIGIIDGPKGSGRVVASCNKYPFQVELEVQLADELPDKPPVDLLLALPRPIMLRRIFSQAAALGVGAIFITHAQRVEKSFWNATLLNEEEYRPHLLHGLEQAVDTRVPEVFICERFKPFIEDVLPSKIREYSHLLIAHPGSSATLKSVIHERPRRILLAIGPEGGWVDYEMDRFAECGFASFSLGERILKVDTAVVAIHGRLSERRESFL
ncbi:MAG: 16S rRNA (uracil(1498)-N(3))-methyltransferase [Proteobacteria bacterium]|jgi:RsmE family RNA methyltransferase|nr:16S rRNA (uracil(1498)-N(3))-methyltransferase [Desulfocapsa sp.]MBU3943414.1 16S rRNA (uracil(1498)-N(3))-methyltransferase [Pseudomonadota bacterium]MCG2744697.1 16S rRNA (uracil(1498)-N(3))-methyltransferase [Desulfobacteraceae bacterium]MBU3983999.1 16S rRNA (uracil(1498)-N(3))-methyltransferase [Pseudomonadota bacterium]MBU4030032.1 16S rRNA (uracil(1498)-N(3))-methyltransferase [Pseudomonadota bacterium]